MTNPTSITISWGDLFDAWEKKNPRAFDDYYHFHSFYGLEEHDLSPYCRLEEINSYQEGAGAYFSESLTEIAIDLAKIDEDRFLDQEFDEDGVTLMIANSD
jgi:hypothetical protein